MKRAIFILSLILTFVAASAQDDVFKRPIDRTFVCDKAEVFTQQQRTALTSKLQTFLMETSVQVLVYTTTDLHGYDIAAFADHLREGWSIGQNGKCIVIVYKPLTIESKEDVTMRTGYGMAAYVPNADKIISDKMIPYFRQGDVYVGINSAVDECISLVKSHAKAPVKAKTRNLWDMKYVLVIVLVGFLIVVILIVVIARILGNHYKNGGRYGRLFRGGFTNYAGTLSGFDGFGRRS
ncbi:MAG: TPM domain-containing protein [Paludibacteraceae bacterium]|jgi:uncharacterized protein|nr:TPM domain-containing protein [Paludibacteraceae bacterium]